MTFKNPGRKFRKSLRRHWRMQMPRCSKRRPYRACQPLTVAWGEPYVPVLARDLSRGTNGLFEEVAWLWAGRRIRGASFFRENMKNDRGPGEPLRLHSRGCLGI